jgi:hypothetical protein
MQPPVLYALSKRFGLGQSAGQRLLQAKDRQNSEHARA